MMRKGQNFVIPSDHYYCLGKPKERFSANCRAIYRKNTFLKLISSDGYYAREGWGSNALIAWPLVENFLFAASLRRSVYATDRVCWGVGESVYNKDILSTTVK